MADLIPNSTGYKQLKSFQKATIIYDLTHYFCQTYLRVGDRTVDQMVQAARSGKQNIAEGVVASSTSHETLLKLLNVAKASLHELLIDYEDYLRVHGFALWERDSAEVQQMRMWGKTENNPEFYLRLAHERDAAFLANMAIVLIYQASYLLDRHLQSASERFMKEGGFREKLSRYRIAARNEERKKWNR